ncbi:hypothetical protein ACT4US_31000, partial [Bacillus sp. HC-Mk]
IPTCFFADKYTRSSCTFGISTSTISEMLIPYDQGQVVSYFNNHAHVLSTSYENEGTKLEVECKTSDYEKYKRFAI